MPEGFGTLEPSDEYLAAGPLVLFFLEKPKKDIHIKINSLRPNKNICVVPVTLPSLLFRLKNSLP